MQAWKGLGDGVIIAISGPPGAGKTTLAANLSAALEVQVLSTGDIARSVDPAAMKVGAMADEDAFRAEFLRRLDAVSGSLILDGIPRSREQMALLPPGTVVIGLTCSRGVAEQRLATRGRVDDTPVLIKRRLAEQRALLEVDKHDGWFFGLGWDRVMSTDLKKPEQVLDGVLAFLEGRKAQVF